MDKEKHPSWFKLKLERKQLVKQLPAENAVNVLLACWAYLETEEIPPTLNTFEKIAVSAFLPDLEEAWAKYEQRVINGSKGGAPKGNRNAQKEKQPYGSVCLHTEPNGTEVEEDTPKGVDSSLTDNNKKNGDAALVGGPPTRFYFDSVQGKTVDRGEGWR